VLKVTENGWRVLRGKETPRLLRPSKKPTKTSKAAKDSWEAVDRGLFETLRVLRRKIALEKGVPAYIVFSDVTLRDMARRKPLTPEDFLKVNGVGDKKCEEYGTRFIAAIKEYSHGT
jgi:ATP-dependent DNA helicase RecQ